jgi:hypothetical protein
MTVWDKLKQYNENREEKEKVQIQKVSNVVFINMWLSNTVLVVEIIFIICLLGLLVFMKVEEQKTESGLILKSSYISEGVVTGTDRHGFKYGHYARICYYITDSVSNCFDYLPENYYHMYVTGSKIKITTNLFYSDITKKERIRLYIQSIADNNYYFYSDAQGMEFK